MKVVKKLDIHTEIKINIIMRGALIESLCIDFNIRVKITKGRKNRMICLINKLQEYRNCLALQGD